MGRRNAAQLQKLVVITLQGVTKVGGALRIWLGHARQRTPSGTCAPGHIREFYAANCMPGASMHPYKASIQPYEASIHPHF